MKLATYIEQAIIIVAITCTYSASSLATTRTNTKHNSSRSGIETRQDAQFKDFAPRIIHQPQSALVQANKPYTVECAIESEPEAEIKWFKDDQLLGARPTRLEQLGNELMFFQMNEEDTGEYRCQATNYLGSILSKSFRLAFPQPVDEPTNDVVQSIDDRIDQITADSTAPVPTNHLDLARNTLRTIFDFSPRLVISIVGALVMFVVLLAGLQLIRMRRAASTSRYLRHQHLKHTESPYSGSSSCGSSSAGSGSGTNVESVPQHADPILISLLGRTLSAPNCAAKAAAAAATMVVPMEYRSCNEHVQRKVAEQQSNHYSTIESCDDHNQLDQPLDQNQRRAGVASQRISSFLRAASQNQMTTDPTRRTSNFSRSSQSREYPDQPSPYAVSSIGSNLSQQHRFEAALPPPPPPVNSEAMRALSEHFDIMLSAGSAEHPPLPPPPPPPHANPRSSHKDNKRRS